MRAHAIASRMLRGVCARVFVRENTPEDVANAVCLTPTFAHIRPHFAQQRTEIDIAMQPCARTADGKLSIAIALAYTHTREQSTHTTYTHFIYTKPSTYRVKYNIALYSDLCAPQDGKICACIRTHTVHSIHYYSMFTHLHTHINKDDVTRRGKHVRCRRPTDRPPTTCSHAATVVCITFSQSLRRLTLEQMFHPHTSTHTDGDFCALLFGYFYHAVYVVVHVIHVSVFGICRVICTIHYLCLCGCVRELSIWYMGHTTCCGAKRLIYIEFDDAFANACGIRADWPNAVYMHVRPRTAHALRASTR